MSGSQARRRFTPEAALPGSPARWRAGVLRRKPPCPPRRHPRSHLAQLAGSHFARLAESHLAPLAGKPAFHAGSCLARLAGGPAFHAGSHLAWLAGSRFARLARSRFARLAGRHLCSACRWAGLSRRKPTWSVRKKPFCPARRKPPLPGSPAGRPFTPEATLSGSPEDTLPGSPAGRVSRSEATLLGSLEVTLPGSLAGRRFTSEATLLGSPARQRAGVPRRPVGVLASRKLTLLNFFTLNVHVILTYFF